MWHKAGEWHLLNKGEVDSMCLWRAEKVSQIEDIWADIWRITIFTRQVKTKIFKEKKKHVQTQGKIKQHRRNNISGFCFRCFSEIPYLEFSSHLNFFGESIFIVLLTFFLNWSIVNLQCCASFWWQQSDSDISIYTHLYIYYFSYSFLFWFSTRYWI